MPRQSMIQPDTLPLREALRGLRFLLRRGGETIADTLNVHTLPPPAANIAGSVLRGVEGFARSVDGVASGLAQSVLGGHDSPSSALQDLVGHTRAEAGFGAALYTALSAVLRRFGVASVFISESAARSAFGALSHPGEPAPELLAADLTLALLEARVVRGVTAEDAALVPGGAVEEVGIYAVLLWLQSARSDSENLAALAAASDIAMALAVEIARTFATKDRDRIAGLYRKYVDHV